MANVLSPFRATKRELADAIVLGLNILEITVGVNRLVYRRNPHPARVESANAHEYCLGLKIGPYLWLTFSPRGRFAL